MEATSRECSSCTRSPTICTPPYKEASPKKWTPPPRGCPGRPRPATPRLRARTGRVLLWHRQREYRQPTLPYRAAWWRRRSP